jgi:hypothetical protein
MPRTSRRRHWASSSCSPVPFRVTVPSNRDRDKPTRKPERAAAASLSHCIMSLEGWVMLCNMLYKRGDSSITYSCYITRYTSMRLL